MFDGDRGWGVVPMLVGGFHPSEVCGSIQLSGHIKGKKRSMQVNLRQSRQGPDIQSVYVDNEFLGVVKPHRSGRGLVAIRKSNGESSSVLFATVAEAAEWLVGNV